MAFQALLCNLKRQNTIQLKLEFLEKNDPRRLAKLQKSIEDGQVERFCSHTIKRELKDEYLPCAMGALACYSSYLLKCCSESGRVVPGKWLSTVKTMAARAPCPKAYFDIVDTALELTQVIYKSDAVVRYIHFLGDLILGDFRCVRSCAICSSKAIFLAPHRKSLSEKVQKCLKGVPRPPIVRAVTLTTTESFIPVAGPSRADDACSQDRETPDHDGNGSEQQSWTTSPPTTSTPVAILPFSKTPLAALLLLQQKDAEKHGGSFIAEKSDISHEDNGSPSAPRQKILEFISSPESEPSLAEDQEQPSQEEAVDLEENNSEDQSNDDVALISVLLGDCFMSDDSDLENRGIIQSRQNINKISTDQLKFYLDKANMTVQSGTYFSKQKNKYVYKEETGTYLQKYMDLKIVVHREVGTDIVWCDDVQKLLDSLSIFKDKKSVLLKSLRCLGASSGLKKYTTGQLANC